MKKNDSIEQRLKKLASCTNPKEFICQLLLIYATPKATITRIEKGYIDLGNSENQIILKGKLLFESFEAKADLFQKFNELKADPLVKRYKPRFVIVINKSRLLAWDAKLQETLDTSIALLSEHSEFFLPWTGKERYVAHQENPADVKAAEKMARIYDEIIKVNPEMADSKTHQLNVFLTRLLFCLFAEDTGIFPGENLFTRSLANFTREDGSDLTAYLEELFDSLDKKNKTKFPAHMREFPYVNGKLFAMKSEIPVLSARARQMILDSGNLDWRQINPDIFGSMFQAVAKKEQRAGLGQHYTSVPNIMKVIEPLFIDALREDFNKAKGSRAKLTKLWDRIAKIKIFDPACGSGNFLIIAYKQLRLLEMDIIDRLNQLDKTAAANKTEEKQKSILMPNIALHNFYGIEIDDFACETATLSLWLAQHQMNLQFKAVFGDVTPTLPLCESGKIVCQNALRVDWESVCPKGKDDEIYILGNPPYEGARKQNATQKSDMDVVFSSFDKYRDLDYIACWFYKAANYIKGKQNIQYAFVSTNSICQGQQVALLWDKILDEKIEIRFGYKSFKWSNNAKGVAGVTCVIIGVSAVSDCTKIIYNGLEKTETKIISPYLESSSGVAVKQCKTPISGFPRMNFGNMPNDGGGLIMVKSEKDALIKEYPQAQKFIRLILGSKEFIRGEKRWCLWIKNEDLPEAIKIPFIQKRIERTRLHRACSKDKGTQKLALRSHQFRDLNEAIKYQLIVPGVSSENREYIPMDILQSNIVISNAALAVYDPPIWLLGVLTSRMHMVWVRAVGGKLETRFRYSAELCYNTFPFPDVSDAKKKEIEKSVMNVVAHREYHCEMTMAELYNPETMPPDLRTAHEALDLCIDRCYQPESFASDEQRLALLFDMYEKLSGNKQH